MELQWNNNGTLADIARNDYKLEMNSFVFRIAYENLDIKT
jgi:hypothetical protein